MTDLALDPFEMELYWQRLLSITDECWTTAHRTAFSPIITEALDLACEILDRRGRAVVHATRSIPSFTTALPAVTKEILRKFPPDEIHDGDVFLTNDPWLCAGHLPDPGLVAPMFHRGKLIGFFGVIGHATDMGGILRRSEARELYEEGLQIPLCRFYERGEPDPLLIEIFRANIRNPDAFLGDLEAQITAATQAMQRVGEFLDEYDLEDLEDLSDLFQDSSERAMRAAVAAIPDGKYEAVTSLDGLDGDPIELRVAITVADDRLAVDFPDCPPQLPRGGVNSTLSYTTSHTLYVLHCILGKLIAANDGCYRPFTVTAPEGSILNCTRPASVGLRMLTGWHVHPAILSALAPVLPDDVRAPSGTMSWIELFGATNDGDSYHDHLIVGAGQGAGRDSDGISGTSYPSSAANVPVEILESRIPVRVVEKSLVPDSGGRGEFRGGLGQRVVLSPRTGSAADLNVSLSLDHRRVPATGVFGGAPGRLARLARVTGPETPEETVDGGYVSVPAGGSITVEVSGGGGYGPPDARDPDAVENDIAHGFVTRW